MRIIKVKKFYTILILIEIVALSYQNNASEDKSSSESEVKTSPVKISTEPIATEPKETEPITTERIVTEPIVTKPITTEPIATEPIATEPITTEPITTEPIATETIANKHLGTKPIVTESIATEPIATESNQASYCDLDHFCDECQICGQDTHNYCSCSFYNCYCKKKNLNTFIANDDFILNYDECNISNQNKEDICGSSNIELQKGSSTASIKISSNGKELDNYILCYYSLNINADLINISVNKEGEGSLEYDIFIIVYYNSGKKELKRILDSDSPDMQLNKQGMTKLSIYCDVSEAKNLNKQSLTMEIMKKDSFSNTIKGVSGGGGGSSSKNNVVYIIVIIVAALIIGIIIVIICVKKRKREPETMVNRNNEETFDQNDTTMDMAQINENRRKVDDIFLKEIKPMAYDKSQVKNDCIQCSICLEDFQEMSSRIATTPCGHTFHYDCLKNWLYKDLKAPKCPLCNYLFLGQPQNNSQGNRFLENLNGTGTYSTFHISHS